MMIDRHNYEEFFLLYIDNELSVDQKKQVDYFIQENPDLAKELEVLQQFKLIPDNSLEFGEKELLMKDESSSFIQLNNYEEWLVLYVDSELNENEKLVVERFAANHVQVQTELSLLLQARLQPEHLVFENKDLLYKRERAAVISLQWWKVAVAAVLILSAGISLFNVFSKGKPNNPIAAHEVVKGGQKSDNVVKPTVPAPGGENVISQKQNSQQLATSTTTRREVVGKKHQQEKTQVQNNGRQLAVKTGDHKKNDNTNGNNTSSDKSPLPINNSNDVATNRNVSNNLPKAVDTNQTAVVTDSHLENINAVPVTNAVSKSPDNSTSDNGYRFASNTSTKKLRGFFRKAARFIEHTTNINPANDDNKVLIGGMAINL